LWLIFSRSNLNVGVWLPWSKSTIIWLTSSEHVLNFILNAIILVLSRIVYHSPAWIRFLSREYVIKETKGVSIDILKTFFVTCGRLLQLWKISSVIFGMHIVICIIGLDPVYTILRLSNIILLWMLNVSSEMKQAWSASSEGIRGNYKKQDDQSLTKYRSNLTHIHYHNNHHYYYFCCCYAARNSLPYLLCKKN
jgi:hypothetical protein